MDSPMEPAAMASQAPAVDPPDPARRLAERLIDDLDLVATIRSWNADEYACLATLEHVRVCVIYDEARLKAFDAVVDEAAARDLSADFWMWLAVLLDPILVSSTLAGVATRCRDWAVDLLEQGPAVVRAPAPFLSDGAMIAWALRHVEPPVFAGPTGERIVEPDTERLLLTQALRAEVRLAIQEGWLIR